MNNPRDGKVGMIRLFITGARVGLIAATIAVILPMITFAQTTRSTVESMPTTTRGVVTSDSLKLDKKSSDRDTSIQTDPSAGLTISAAENVEIQHRFNELKRELLDNRAAYIDLWLFVIGIFLTFLSIVAVVAGYIGFRRFREIETEAKDSARIATEHAEDAKRLVGEIEKNRDKSAEIIQALNAETVADKPEEAEQAVANIRENPGASPIDRAVARAVSLQQQNKIDEAIENWRAVARIAEGIDNDQAARAWFSVGYLLGDSEESILAYGQAISLKSDFAEAYNNRGLAKSELGHYKDDIADFDEAIRLKPDLAEAYSNRGNAKIALGQHNEAIADYDKAIRLKPDLAEAYSNRGVAKAKLGQHNEAIADYDKAIQLKQNYADAYNNRGNAKALLERYADAIADYDVAIRLKPDYVEAYNARGTAKVRLERYADAIADYDEAIRLQPDFAEAYYNRGIAKGALGLIDEARQDFGNARDLAREAGNDSIADAAEQRLRKLDATDT